MGVTCPIIISQVQLSHFDDLCCWASTNTPACGRQTNRQSQVSIPPLIVHSNLNILLNSIRPNGDEPMNPFNGDFTYYISKFVNRKFDGFIQLSRHYNGHCSNSSRSIQLCGCQLVSIVPKFFAFFWTLAIFLPFYLDEPLKQVI